MQVLLLADTLRDRYRLRGVATEDDVDRILGEHGLTICERWPFVGRVKALLVEDHVFLAKGLCRGERTAYKAHELGHFLLHEGNGLYLQVPARQMMNDKRERQAQLFAGALLLGSPVKTRRTIEARLAEAHGNGVPLDFLCSYASAIVAEFGVRMPAA